MDKRVADVKEEETKEKGSQRTDKVDQAATARTSPTHRQSPNLNSKKKRRHSRRSSKKEGRKSERTRRSESERNRRSEISKRVDGLKRLPSEKDGGEREPLKTDPTLDLKTDRRRLPPTSEDVVSAELQSGNENEANHSRGTPKMKHARPGLRIDRKKKKRNAAQARKAIEEQCWYHGVSSLEDVEPLLVRTGDFLVLASDSGSSRNLVLSLRSGDRKLHLPIAASSKGDFYISSLTKEHCRYFKTVYDLVHYYQFHHIRLKEPNSEQLSVHHLKEGVPRPKWFVRSDLITYDSYAKPLGSGNFANVFIGTFLHQDPVKGRKIIPVAIKVLKEMVGSSEEKEAKQSMIREGKVMSFYNHTNVVQFYGMACDHPQVLVLVMEYCPGGSLDSHLKHQKGKVLDGEKVTFAFEAALGMRYLHSQGCLHRDLAARNCLISSEGIVKISDFGLSSADGIAERRALKNIPLRWMAPETLSKQPKFSPKSDVWAYGVLLFEIFSDGGRPWPNESWRQIARNIRTINMPEMPRKTPPPIKEIVAAIWLKQTRIRPSFCSIVSRLAHLRLDELKPIEADKCSVNLLPNVHRVDYLPDVEDIFDEDTPVGATETGGTTTETGGTTTETGGTRTGAGSPPTAEKEEGVLTAESKPRTIEKNATKASEEETVAEKLPESSLKTDKKPVEMSRKSAESPAKKPADKSTKKHFEKRTERSVEKSVKKPAERVTEKTAETPSEKPAEMPHEKPADIPPKKPFEKPSEKATEKPAEKQNGILIENPSEKLAERPAENAVINPAEKPGGDPVEKCFTPPSTKKSSRSPKKSSKSTEKASGPAEKSSKKSSRTTEKSSELTEKSSTTTEKSSGLTEKSSTTTEKSSGLTEKSPTTTKKSSKSSKKSSRTTEKSSEQSCKKPVGKEDEKRV